MEPPNEPNVERNKSAGQSAIDTQVAAADPTLDEVGEIVRDAICNHPHEELDSRSREFIAKLARLATIKKLSDCETWPTIANYEILDLIGQGGMGQVYRARHRQLGKIQAVKVIRSETALNSDGLARFRREVKTLGALNHPNIVAAHDANFEGEYPYLVMDYIEGDSLWTIQRRLARAKKAMSVGAACELVRQAADGMQYAHEQGITHRDLKPGNLILDRSGVVRVLDLGLARWQVPSDEAAPGTMTELTHAGQMLGTPDYMSPEQLRSSRSVDARTDVYSLGITLYSLIVGQPVFPSKRGENFITVASRILHEPVPNVSKKLPNLPKELAGLIHKCLAKDPDERIQTAGELATELARWADPSSLHLLLAPRPDVKPQLAATSVASSKRAALGDQTKQSARSLPKLIERSTKPKRPRWKWLAVIGLGFLIPALLVATVITLMLPGGGQLVIDCADPNAQLHVVAVKDGQREELALTLEQGNTLKLREGRWDLKITGVKAEEFEVSQDEVVINSGTPSEIRVTRREVAANPVVVALPENQPASTVASDAATAEPPYFPLTPPATEVSPALPDIAVKQLDSPKDSFETAGDSRSIDSAPTIAGLLPTSVPIANGAAWQIRPWFPELRDETSYLTENRIAIDPSGKFYAVLTQYDCKIFELASGVPLHTIPNPPDSQWGGADLTHDCQRIALLSSNGDAVEVRDERNRVLSRWFTQRDGRTLIDGNQSWGAIAWMRDGQRLLIWDHRHANIVDIEGNSESNIDFEPQAGPEHLEFDQRMTLQRSVDVATDDSMVAFGCADGKVRVWRLKDGSLTELPTERSDEPISCVQWSPNGQLLGSLRASRGNAIAMEVWNANGMLAAKFSPEQLSTTSQSASQFCWAPKTAAIALGSGRVIDFSGKRLRDFNLADDKSRPISAVWIPSWSEPQRINFVAAGEHYGLHSGRILAFAPTGKSLSSSPLGNVLEPQAVSWIEESGELAVVYSRLGASELHTWNAQGKHLASANIPGFVEGKIQSFNGNQLCLSPWGAKVFDRKGNPLGTHDLPRANFEVGHAAWNHRGDQTAYLGQADGNSFVRIVDVSGSRSVDLPLPIGQFNLNSGYFHWSGDDRYLALSLQASDTKQRLLVWEATKPASKSTVDLNLDDAETPSVAWNPNNQSIAVAAGGGNSSKEYPVRFVDVSNGNVREFRTEHPFLPQWDQLEWVDAASVRVGGIVLNVPPDASTDIGVSELGFSLKRGEIAFRGVQPGEYVRSSQDARGASQLEILRDGQLHGTVVTPPIANSQTARNRSGTKAVFISHQNPDSFWQYDLEQHRVDFIAVMCDDGTIVKLNSEGQLLDPAPSTDQYLCYLIRYPGDAEVAISRAEFDRRQQASPAIAAMQWLLDIGGSLTLQGSQSPITNRTANVRVNALDQSEIISIDCIRCPITVDSLAQLSHFPNLAMLSVSQTSIKDTAKYREQYPSVRIVSSITE